MTNIKVVLVDDHQIIRDGLRALIGQQPQFHVVAEASDGWEAVDIASNVDYDVMLMDISMPKLTGIEATEKILKTDPDAKILALTMHDEDSFIIRMLQVGTKGFLIKTTSKDNLCKAIEMVNGGGSYFSNEVSEAVVKYFTSTKQEQDRSSSGRTELTKREIEVLILIAEGHTNQEIAAKLFLSPRTIDSHRRNLLQKLKVKNTAGLVKYAIENKIVAL